MFTRLLSCEEQACIPKKHPCTPQVQQQLHTRAVSIQPRTVKITCTSNMRKCILLLYCAHQQLPLWSSQRWSLELHSSKWSDLGCVGRSRTSAVTYNWNFADKATYLLRFITINKAQSTMNNRQTTIDNRQSTIHNPQSAKVNLRSTIDNPQYTKHLFPASTKSKPVRFEGLGDWREVVLNIDS